MTANNDPTLEEVLEFLDPDWRDHFLDAGEAAVFYQTFGFDDWCDAVRELRST